MEKPPVSNLSPSLPYDGLTILFSNPSRFDVDSGRLLSGFAGNLVQSSFRQTLLQQADVQILSAENAFLPDTKVILLFGSIACDKYWPGDNSLTLNQLRGNPFENPRYPGIIFIASYLPQDAIDFKASYEKDNNSYLSDSDDDTSENAGSSKDEKSTKGKTSRKNFRFFLEQDIIKACRILRLAKQGFSLEAIREPSAIYRTYEGEQELLSVMYRPSNQDVFLDIENDAQLNITVFSLSFNDEREVYIIPLKRYNYHYAYSELSVAKLLRALAYLFKRCRVVVHNGMHDLLVLAKRYHIPIPRNVYDTMLATARLYPGVEKSLGHAGSLFTCEPYHKNEGEFNPAEEHAELNLWQYNGKDVWLMKKIFFAQIKVAQDLHAVTSIQQINSSFYAYLLMTLTGIRYDAEKIAAHITRNERRLAQLQRVLNILVGHELLPTSNKQMVNYFHNELELKVVKRGKPGKKNPLGNPSLDEKALYSLYVQNDHPVIPVVLEYRRVQKESSMLGFEPWKH